MTARSKTYMQTNFFPATEQFTNLGVPGDVTRVEMRDLLDSIPLQDANGVFSSTGTGVVGSAPTVQRLSKTTVLLTAAADTALYTVPTGFQLVVDDIILEGLVTQSGGTSSKLLVGTAANSYNELLAGTTGHTFTSGTATSLLAVGARVKGEILVQPATASVVNKKTFAAGAAIVANVSGTVVTAGSISVEIHGYLLPV